MLIHKKSKQKAEKTPTTERKKENQKRKKKTVVLMDKILKRVVQKERNADTAYEEKDSDGATALIILLSKCVSTLYRDHTLHNIDNNDNARSNEKNIDETEHKEENKTQSTIFVSLIDRKCELIRLSKRSKRYIDSNANSIVIL